MCDEWMRPLELKITFDEFTRLPRNNAYKYEYLDGHAYLTPRPKYYHALLDLASVVPAVSETKTWLRPFETADWTGLLPAFAASFIRQQPFSGLTPEERLEALRTIMERTRAGGDGPVIESACRVALDGDGGAAIGAALVTLLPDADASDWGSFQWKSPPPADCIDKRLGRPHLTWIFVHPLYAGHGAGTAMLIEAARDLRRLGYRELASTFLPTNDSSVLWHWRNGFRLVEYAGSMRRSERQIRESLG